MKFPRETLGFSFMSVRKVLDAIKEEGLEKERILKASLGGRNKQIVSLAKDFSVDKKSSNCGITSNID